METTILDVRQWNWKLDIPGMLCLNEEHNVVVRITNEGAKIKGQILNMSTELFGRIAAHRNGPTIVQQIVFAAEDEYRSRV